MQETVCHEKSHQMDEDLLLQIFLRFTPETLIKTELICKKWRRVLVANDSSIFRFKALQDICRDNELHHLSQGMEFLKKIKLIKGETWKRSVDFKIL